MKKDIIRYCFLTIILVLILGFVYPTMYRYDKYDQKIPVRINRVTGAAEMLSATGWKPAEETAPSKTEIQMFKEQMDLKFDGLKQDVEVDISNHLRAEVVKDIKSDIRNAKAEIETYKKSQLDPNNSFTTGSSMEAVKKIMGPPNSISDYGGTAFWNYGRSQVKFENGKVIGWDISDVKLNVK